VNPPSEKTLRLLYDFEVGGGETYYTEHLSRFTWPGLSSGPTIAIGIDCGYYTPEDLGKIFSFLPPDHTRQVQGASGKTGEDGKAYTAILRKSGITVTWPQAQKIFVERTWPKFSALTDRVFPGSDGLHPDAYGALVSLVFNRGGSLVGDRRSEMRAIRDLVPSQDYAGIARELRAMKRLWANKGMTGLLRRRDAEAALVESAGESLV
jgi:GH24 family phage-related lysozyme (muramidase)